MAVHTTRFYLAVFRRSRRTWVRFSHDRLDALRSLPARLPGWTITIEFRDRSWYDAASETLTALKDTGLAHVVVDAPLTPNAVPRVTTATGPRHGLVLLQGGLRRQTIGVVSPA